MTASIQNTTAQPQGTKKPIFPEENQCFPSSKGAIDSHRGWVKLEGGNRLAPASLPRIRERAIGLAPQIVKLQGGNRIRTLDSHHGRAIDLQGGGARAIGPKWKGGGGD